MEFTLVQGCLRGIGLYSVGLGCFSVLIVFFDDTRCFPPHLLHLFLLVRGVQVVVVAAVLRLRWFILRCSSRAYVSVAGAVGFKRFLSLFYCHGRGFPTHSGGRRGSFRASGAPRGPFQYPNQPNQTNQPNQPFQYRGFTSWL